MTRSPLFVALEAGTSGGRAVAFDSGGRMIAQVRRPYATATARPGWAEQDAEAWASAALGSLRDLTSKIEPDRVAAVGLTGQSPTVVPVDDEVRPLRLGMLYRDNRAVEEAAVLREVYGVEKIHEITGHAPAAFHVGPKIMWIRTHEPQVFAKTRWFLQPRDLILHRLTGHVLTDESHANATALFDLVGRHWATAVLDAIDLDVSLLPDVRPPWWIVDVLSTERARELGLPAGVPIVLGAGDSQCAALGASVVAPGPASEMAGSSSCLNTTVRRPLHDVRVTHYSHVVPDAYTTELGLNTTGAALTWAVETLGFRSFQILASSAQDGRRQLAATPEADAIAAAPFFAPHLGDGERDDVSHYATLARLSARHGRAALAYAVIEGVAAAVTEQLGVLKSAGAAVDELRVAGGGTRLGCLGQAKADLLGIPVLHLDVDASALGAAMLAARSSGFDDEAAAALGHALARATTFVPDPAFAGHARCRLSIHSEI